jgi:proteasome lid subunit RPN8/RPN11
MQKTVHLAVAGKESVISAATAAFPRECCGLLEGFATPGGWSVVAAHETPNISEQPERRFLIDPQHQFDLLHRLRGTDRALIGCFHSHPYGHPKPSPTDLASAVDEDFLWLIAGGMPGNFTLKCYAFVHDAFQPVALVQGG